jgi:transposase
MAQTVSLLLSAQHSADLEGVIEDRGRPVKHVQRAQIILLSAGRLPVLEIANRVGVSRPMVWRWQQRFAEEGIEGLLRDKTRPPGIPPVPQAKVHAVVERTLREPPGAVTHWTGRAMAKAMGLSLRTIQRIWAAHKLQWWSSDDSVDSTIRRLVCQVGRKVLPFRVRRPPSLAFLMGRRRRPPV